MNETVIDTLAIIGVITVLWFVFKFLGIFSVIGLYITTKFCGAPVSFIALVMMKIRKVDVAKVIQCHIMLFKTQIPVELSELELAILEGRNLDNLSKGLTYAKKKGLSLNLNQAKEADLKGLDIMGEIDSKLSD